MTSGELIRTTSGRRSREHRWTPRAAHWTMPRLNRGHAGFISGPHTSDPCRPDMTMPCYIRTGYGRGVRRSAALGGSAADLLNQALALGGALGRPVHRLSTPVRAAGTETAGKR